MLCQCFKVLVELLGKLVVSKGEALVALRRVRNRKKQRAFEVRLRDDEGDYVFDRMLSFAPFSSKEKAVQGFYFETDKTPLQLYLYFNCDAEDASLAHFKIVGRELDRLIFFVLGHKIYRLF